MKMKKYIILLVAVLSGVFSGTVVLVILLMVMLSDAFESNLRHSEQMDFLINAVKIRLEQRDPALLQDIQGLDRDYQRSYEGRDFRSLMKRYFPEQFARYDFSYNR